MIYFDNSATSYPKPAPAVRKTVDALKNLSFNSGRGGYKEAVHAAEEIYAVREKVGKMFSAAPNNVIFTKNCTEALNIAIKGSVQKGEHVILSSLEHNSVSRVVQQLYLDGVAEYDFLPFSYDNDEITEAFEMLLQPKTTLLVCMHSSNAFGVTFPIRQLGAACKKHGVRFVVDAAQGAGVFDIRMDRDNIDILCTAGHKSLFGSMGTGLMVLQEGVALRGLMQGGTGSSSLSPQQPAFTPDKFEAGTLNNSGIVSLGAGIGFIEAKGMENIYAHEMRLCSVLYDGLKHTDGVTLYTPPPQINQSAPIISFNLKDYSSEKVASLLGERHICTRAGYHCAPLAHRYFHTLERGTVRLSPGVFNTEKECFYFLDILKKL